MRRKIQMMKSLYTQIFLVSLICLLSINLLSCDMFEKEVSPEKLPPIPEECIPLSNRYTETLTLAYTSVKASQMQSNILANKLSQCLKDAGLTKAEAKGIVKDLEKKVSEEVEKGGASDEYFYR